MIMTAHFLLQHATADVSVMLLGAKQDLESKREIDVEDGKRVWFWVSNSFGHFFTFLSQFAATHEISHFYEVSAKTGHNVGEAFFTFFQDVHRKVCSPMLPYAPLRIWPLLTWVCLAMQAQGTVQEAAPQPPTPTQSSCCGRWKK